MHKRFFGVFIFLTLFFSFLPNLRAAEEEGKSQWTAENWKPVLADTLWVNIETNSGFLRHADGSFLQFPVVSGQKRRVCYIGLCYFAKTPARRWKIKSVDYKGDRYTYGPSGQFLRLYIIDPETGAEEYSHYGIHTHRDITDMLDSDNRYRSYGCVLVTQEILNLIYETYVLNGQELEVTTY